METQNSNFQRVMKCNWADTSGEDEGGTPHWHL